jgi:fructokinase
MNEKLCIFGEVLFDVFPDGNRVLGGAPFNVAWHLQAFGQSPYFISRIGNDHDGIQIQKSLMDHGMNTYALQIDEELPTGLVNIDIKDGEPHYDIVNPSAYDNIQPVSISEKCHLLYHGTLALRNQASEKSLQELLKTRPENIFIDVNLRPPWWNREQVLQLLKHADWVKLNKDELGQLFDSGKPEDEKLAAFIKEFNLKGAILTHGSKGAEILTAEGQHHKISPAASQDNEINIVDTVGAGDAFSSIVILGLMNKWPLQQIIERAQAFASAIVQQQGATVTDKSFYADFSQSWQLN